MRHGVTLIELNRAFSATVGNVLLPGAPPQADGVNTAPLALNAHSDSIKNRPRVWFFERAAMASASDCTI